MTNPTPSDAPTMRAIVAHTAGGPEVLDLESVALPSPGPTEVLVRVNAAGVNPADWKNRRSGNLVPPPQTPGWDIAGVIAELGVGVTRFAVGDRVFGMPRFPNEASAYAEYVTSPSRHLARTPDALTDVEAAALPLAGLTAYQALVDTAQISRGTRLLVLAAAGGVGHLAVQIAKAHGAYVVGTARARHHRRLAELGADELIDYTEHAVADRVADVDVVLDLVGGDAGAEALPALRDDGLFINIPSGRDAEHLREIAAGRVRIANLLVEPDSGGLEALACMVDDGRLRPHVSQTFALERAAEAHEVSEHRRTAGGKLVLITH